MTTKFNPAGEHPQSLDQTARLHIHDVERQRLRILRCTAQAMASSPGGLRFKAGSQPWLDGISGGLEASSRANRLHGRVALQAACA